MRKRNRDERLFRTYAEPLSMMTAEPHCFDLDLCTQTTPHLSFASLFYYGVPTLGTPLPPSFQPFAQASVPNPSVRVKGCRSKPCTIPPARQPPPAQCIDHLDIPHFISPYVDLTCIVLYYFVFNLY